MPGSSNRGKILIDQWVDSLPIQLKSVLDVGPGWGTYSRLLRRKRQRWDAVEIHAPYVKEFELHKHYNDIFIEDIRTFQPTRRYDLILMGDILEHIPNDDGVKVLKKLLGHCSYLILSLPLDAETNAPSENNEHYWDNPHERHQALWSNKELLKSALSLGADVLSMHKFQELAVYLLSSDQQRAYMDESVLAPSDWFKYRYGLKYETHDGRLRTKTLLLGAKFAPERLKRAYRRIKKTPAS